MATDIILSALLTFSSRVLYAFEGVPMPDFWTFTRLDDQKLGGLIMWVPGGFIHVIILDYSFLSPGLIKKALIGYSSE